MLVPEAESDPPDQLFLLAPSVIQQADIQVEQRFSATPVIFIQRSEREYLCVHSLSVRHFMCTKAKVKSLQASVDWLWFQNNLTPAVMSHLQVHREPAAVPAVSCVPETAKPELPSLSILG